MLTVQPFWLMFLIAVAAMALPIYQVCRREVGTVHLAAHCVKPSAWAKARAVVSAARGLFLRFWPIAAAAAVLVLVAHIQAHDAGGLSLAVVAVSPFKLATQHVSDVKAKGLKLIEGLRAAEAAGDDKQRAAVTKQLQAVEAELTEAQERLADETRVLEIERAFATGHRESRDAHVRPAASRKYRDVFAAELGGGLSNDGFASLNDYLATVHSGLAHPALRAATMNSTTGSSGGFFVPSEHAAELLDKSLESEIVRPRANVVPMVGDTKKIAGFDNLDHTGNTLYGGFEAVWLAQEGTASDQAGDIRMIELKARKLALFTRASNELVADGMSFEEQIGNALVAAIGWGLDYACLRGTGAGQPIGVLNDPALVTVSKETGQAAATVLYANLVKMFARLHPACVGNSVWVANSTAIPQLAQLSIPIGTGGSHIPVMTESNGRFQILTRPVLFTEKLPALGTKGDVLLCDFSQYTIGLRKEVSVEKSIHVGWQNDTSGYRAILRADGQGRWSKPLTPANGDTQSWCVALATRS